MPWSFKISAAPSCSLPINTPAPRRAEGLCVLWNALSHKFDSDSQKAGKLFGFELGILDLELAVFSLFFVLDVELFFATSLGAIACFFAFFFRADSPTNSTLTLGV